LDGGLAWVSSGADVGEGGYGEIGDVGLFDADFAERGGDADVFRQGSHGLESG